MFKIPIEAIFKHLPSFPLFLAFLADITQVHLQMLNAAIFILCFSSNVVHGVPQPLHSYWKTSLKTKRLCFTPFLIFVCLNTGLGASLFVEKNAKGSEKSDAKVKHFPQRHVSSSVGPRVSDS